MKPRRLLHLGLVALWATVLVVSTLGPTVRAASFISVGTGGWHSKGTWDTVGFPTASDAVTIATGHTVTVDADAECDSLAIQPGGTLVIPLDVTLTVMSSVTNNGTLVQTQVVNNDAVDFLELHDSNGVSSVHWTVYPDTATGDEDYAPRKDTLTFLEGETSKTIQVVVHGDKEIEKDETFIVELVTADNATILDGSGTGIIENDDSAACPFPPKDPANGKYDNCVDTPHGGVCPLTCDLGYTKTGDAVCNSGTWAQPAPECVPNTCHDYPPTPPHGKWSCTPPVQHGGACPLVCDAGYQPSGDGAATCSLGKWTSVDTCDAGSPSRNVARSPSADTASPDVAFANGLSIDDVSQAEGDSGETIFEFTVTRSNPTSNNVYYRGARVASSSNLGEVKVSVRGLNDGEYCTSTGATSPKYARRCYGITPQFKAAAEVTLWALDSELNGIAESDLAIYHHDGSKWVKLSTNRVAGNDGSGRCYARGDSAQGFSPFLLGSNNESPTAVTVQALAVRPDMTRSVALVAGLVLMVGIGLVLAWRMRRT